MGNKVFLVALGVALVAMTYNNYLRTKVRKFAGVWRSSLGKRMRVKGMESECEGRLWLGFLDISSVGKGGEKEGRE